MPTITAKRFSDGLPVTVSIDDLGVEEGINSSDGECQLAYVTLIVVGDRFVKTCAPIELVKIGGPRCRFQEDAAFFEAMDIDPASIASAGIPFYQAN